jgi:CHAT domain-containing protein
VSLVVLSACETGKIGSYDEDLSRRFPVGDDLVGLTRAFIIAGARSVLASLWRVDDDATASRIEEFHRCWSRNPAAGKAEALRQAQLMMQRRGAERPETHWDLPYYWAAFVVTGAED